MKDLALNLATVEALQTALGCEDLFEWIELEAAELARLGSHHGRVGFNRTLLRSRGIHTVVRESGNALAHDAAIEFDRTGSVIRYVATTPTRIRFSLAHEIGHTYLAGPEGRPVSRLEHGTDPTIESICDYFARALLLPKDRVAEHLGWLVGRRSIPPLHLVPRLASEFEASEQAVARRLVFDLFDGFVAAACITRRDEREGWRTTWCAPLGEHDLPKTSGWRVPLRSNGRRVPPEMVPTCGPGQTTVTSVDGRWADLCRPKTTAQCRVPFSRLPAQAGAQAVVALVAGDRGLFDEPLERCFVALRQGP